MKTLREIQDEVAKYYGYENYDHILWHITRDIVSIHFANDYLYDCFIEVQRQAQHKINKRIEDDYLNDNFDSQSIINDKNIIR